MGYSSGIISAPVEIDDIQDALHDNSEDVLNDLCMHENINVWAKYKPVRYNYPDTRKDPSNPNVSWIDANNEWTANAVWWRNPQGVYGSTLYCCGFRIPGLAGVDENIADNLGQWEYQRPRGGSYNEPYRQLDFLQYYVGAVCPFSVELPARAVLANGILRGKVFFRTTAWLSSLNLDIDDIFGQGFQGTAYFGVAAVKGTSVYIRTQDDNSPLVSLEDLNSAMSLAAGDVITLVCFATRTKSTSWITGGTTQVYSISAPDIGFAVIGECEVVETRDTVYQLAIAGLEGTDKSALRAGTATLSNSTISARNRGSSNFNHSYMFDMVTVHTDKIDADGNVTSMSAYDHTYTNITVSPNYLEPHGGPYNDIDCDALFTEGDLPGIPDPTVEFYQITYTIHYVRD